MPPIVPPGPPAARLHPEGETGVRRLADDIGTADRKLFQTLKSSVRWVKYERETPAGLPFFRKLALWRRGFFSKSAILYEFPRNDPRQYISDYAHLVRCWRLNAWQSLYEHKLALRAFLLARGFRQAETVAYIHGYRVLLDPFTPGSRAVRLDALLERLRGDGSAARYVVKPEASLLGRGLFLLEYLDGRFVRRRGRETAPFDIVGFEAEMRAMQQHHGPTNPWLIERWVEQGEFWRMLHPESANTIRLLTLWHPDDPGPFLARAVQRIGTAKTVPADHWANGGVSAPIDSATGELGMGRLYPRIGREAMGSDTRVERHPDTGAPITGQIVPGWDRIVETVLRAAAGFPFNRIAGWDVLVDREDVPVIIEANGNSAVSLLQAHGGLLSDPRVRRFYQAYGVV
ncbi:MAG: sugar-transfer associated ATP-grasp domain-containing protein [Gemmatimonadales bacterium]